MPQGERHNQHGGQSGSLLFAGQWKQAGHAGIAWHGPAGRVATLAAMEAGPGETPPRATTEPDHKRLRRWDIVSSAIALGLAIVLLVAFATLAPGFRSASVGLSLSAAWWFYTLLAMGLTLVMTTGRMDLSGASVAALAGAVAAKLAVMGVPLLLGFLPGALLAAAIGTVNGLIATVSRSASYVGTLATAAFCQALTAQLVGVSAIALPHGPGGLTPLIVPAVLLAVAAAALAVIALLSPAGDRLRGVGRESQPVAARVLLVTLVGTYAAAAMLAAGAGVGQVAQAGLAFASVSPQTEIAIIAAAILGGASLRGGRGAGYPAVVSALALTVLLFGLSAAGASLVVSTAVVGVLLAAVLLWDELRPRLIGSG